MLLKLGTYGFLRFSLPLFPKASFFFTPLIDTIAVIGIIYASFTAIRQTDFKRIVAYTSIAHMNLVILGIFSFNVIGLEGAILQSLSHGFIASGLFLVIGVVYDRYRTRIVQYYGGLATVMPVGVKKMWYRLYASSMKNLLGRPKKVEAYLWVVRIKMIVFKNYKNSSLLLYRVFLRILFHLLMFFEVIECGQWNALKNIVFIFKCD